MPTFNGLSMSVAAHRIALQIQALTGFNILPEGFAVKPVKPLLRQLYSATGGKRGPAAGFDPNGAQLCSVYNGVMSGAQLYALHTGGELKEAEPEAPVLIDDVPTDDAVKALQALLGGQKINPEAVKKLATEAVDSRIGDVLSRMAGLVADEVSRAVKTVTVKVATLPPVTVTNAHRDFDKVLRYCANRVNVMLKGPAGCGKTFMAAQAAKTLGLSFEFSGKCVDETKLLGYMDGGGSYRSTGFRRAFEFGGVFLADEMDAWAPEALIALNAPLDGEYCDFPDGVVTKHPDFVVIAGVNTDGNGADRDYRAREALDAASLNRFAFVEMDYDEDLERAISCNDKWTAHVQKVRAAYRKLGTVRGLPPTPRASKFGGIMLAAGAPWAECEEAFIWKGLKEETRNLVKAELR